MRHPSGQLLDDLQGLRLKKSLCERLGTSHVVYTHLPPGKVPIGVIDRGSMHLPHKVARAIPGASFQLRPCDPALPPPLGFHRQFLWAYLTVGTPARVHTRSRRHGIADDAATRALSTSPRKDTSRA